MSVQNPGQGGGLDVRFANARWRGLRERNFTVFMRSIAKSWPKNLEESGVGCERDRSEKNGVQLLVRFGAVPKVVVQKSPLAIGRTTAGKLSTSNAASSATSDSKRMPAGGHNPYRCASTMPNGAPASRIQRCKWAGIVRTKPASLARGFSASCPRKRPAGNGHANKMRCRIKPASGPIP